MNTCPSLSTRGRVNILFLLIIILNIKSNIVTATLCSTDCDCAGNNCGSCINGICNNIHECESNDNICIHYPGYSPTCIPNKAVECENDYQCGLLIPNMCSKCLSGRCIATFVNGYVSSNCSFDRCGNQKELDPPPEKDVDNSDLDSPLPIPIHLPVPMPTPVPIPQILPPISKPKIIKPILNPITPKITPPSAETGLTILYVFFGVIAILVLCAPLWWTF